MSEAKTTIQEGVILCTSAEQGAKIIEYFKSLGVDTGKIKGEVIGAYYGLINDRFFGYLKSYVKKYNIPILTLPDELGWKGENTKAVEVMQGENTASIKFTLQTQEQPTQELHEINFEGIEMEVSNNEVDWKRRKVLAKLKNQYLAFNTHEDSVFIWNHARPIAQKVKVTKEQIAEAFNTTVDNLVIKSDE